MSQGHRKNVRLNLLSCSSSATEEIERAARLLNQAQNIFVFEATYRRGLALEPGETFHKWASVESALRGAPDANVEFNFGILDEPIENNWFSRACWGKAIAFITTYSWEFISPLPVGAFIAYEVVENLVEL